jgi:hypothetical protein
MRDGGGIGMLHARLRVPAVPPSVIWQALTDPARMVRWFQANQQLLGAADGPGQDAYFRGSYHFWSFFTPHAPPDPQHTLLAVHWPQTEDGSLRLHYGWQMRGHKSDVFMDCAPLDGGGTLVGIEHRGLPEELPGLGSSRAYWTLVLENMRLYLLGRDGLLFHHSLPPGALGPGERGLATELVTPAGLDATAAAWEMLTTPGALDGLLPHPFGERLYAAPPHAAGPDIIAARLDTAWQAEPLGLPGVLSWRLAGSGSRTRITIVQSGFAGADRGEPAAAADRRAAAQDEAHWLADWRSVLGQMRGQLDLGEDWTRVELD